ncbi:MAG: hypothetical protein II847_07025 [Ruminobacter sp.]|nr:hypothetical protein [Ruminobacter sp.]
MYPFCDGNGRTGRIVNILYLIQQGLLDTPIPYLSRYINQNRSEYCKCMQNVREPQSSSSTFLNESLSKGSQPHPTVLR